LTISLAIAIFLILYLPYCVIIENIKIVIRGERNKLMAMSYKKLWKLLIDKDLKKKQLAELAGVSQYTINKITRGDTVTTETLIKICTALQCDIGDICEVVSER